MISMGSLHLFIAFTVQADENTAAAPGPPLQTIRLIGSDRYCLFFYFNPRYLSQNSRDTRVGMAFR